MASTFKPARRHGHRSANRCVLRRRRHRTKGIAMLKTVRAAVLHVNTAAYLSTSPTMRIARFVAEELGVPLVHDLATARRQLRQGKLDVLFVKYGLFKFSQHREEALKLHRRAGMIVD